jgi:hypothetical protein
MSCKTKGLSSSQMAKSYGITQKTAWFFMQKVKLGMKSSFQNSMTGAVQVDEIIIGGKETGKQGRSYDSKKAKVVCAVELTKNGKLKRAYAKIIDNYKAEAIKPLFDEHIDKTANIKTDKWTAIQKFQKSLILLKRKVIQLLILNKCTQFSNR